MRSLPPDEGARQIGDTGHGDEPEHDLAGPVRVITICWVNLTAKMKARSPKPNTLPLKYVPTSTRLARGGGELIEALRSMWGWWRRPGWP
jgi:hypothetical protein